MVTIAYTTFDTARTPVNCGAHLEITENGKPTVYFHKYGDANTVISHDNTMYYLSYDSTRPVGTRCCVYYAKEVVISGRKVWVKSEKPAIFCEVRKSI